MATTQSTDASIPPVVEAAAKDDRREGSRHRTVRLTAKLIDSEGEQLCLLRDISAEGMMANIYSEIQLQENVTVEFPNGHRVVSNLVWLRDGSAGFQFSEPVDIDRMLHPANDDLPRRAPRIHSESLARLIGQSHSQMAEVVDISLGGAKLKTGPAGRSGDHLGIQFDGLPRKSCRIRWTRPGMIGVKFDAPLSFDELCDWLNARRPKSSSPPKGNVVGAA